MKYNSTGDSLDSLDAQEQGRISDIKERIEKTDDTREKERLFKEIVPSILEKHEFHKIEDGQKVSKRRGVPFDFLAVRKEGLSLIELKGSHDTFNYSKEVQYARLHHVVNELKQRGIEADTFLLQINLKYHVYQILDSNFYANVFKRIDINRGWDCPIVDIVDDIISWMRIYGCPLFDRLHRMAGRDSKEKNTTNFREVYLYWSGHADVFCG